MTDQLDLEAAYRAVQRGHARQYRASNRAGYEQIIRDVTAYYKGQKKGFARIMAEIEKRCATANGLADFETWVSTQLTTEAAP